MSDIKNPLDELQTSHSELLTAIARLEDISGYLKTARRRLYTFLAAQHAEEEAKKQLADKMRTLLKTTKFNPPSEPVREICLAQLDEYKDQIGEPDES